MSPPIAEPIERYGAAEHLRQQHQPSPTTGEVLMAHLNTENTIGLVLNSLSEHWEPAQEFFYGHIDPRLKELEFNINSLEGTIYEPYQKDFLNVTTEAQALVKKKRIERELRFHETIARGTISSNLVASLAAGLVDPTSWITLSMLGLPKIAATAATKLALGTTARAALHIGAEATVQAVAGEAIAQGLSYERTWAESAVNISTSALLGGLIGGGASKFTQRMRAGWREKVEPKFAKDMEDIATGDTPGSTTGTQATTETVDVLPVTAIASMAQKVHAPTGPVIALPTTAVATITPGPSTIATRIPRAGGHAATGPVTAVPPLPTTAVATITPGEIATLPTDIGFEKILKGKARKIGKKTAAEERIAQSFMDTGTIIGNAPGWRNQMAKYAHKWFGRVTPGNRLAMSPSTKAQEAARRLITYGFSLDSNADYIATNPRTVHILATSAKMVAMNQKDYIFLETQKNLRAAGYKISKDRLSKEMYAAYTNGFNHESALVNDALKKLKKEIFEPFKQRAIDVGMFTSEIRTKYAKEYLPRLWNRDAIKRNRAHFEKLTIQGHIRERDFAIAERQILLDENKILHAQALREKMTSDPMHTETQRKIRKNIHRIKRLKKDIRTDKQIIRQSKEDILEILTGVNSNIEYPISRRDRKRLLPIENEDALPYLIDDMDMASNALIQKMSTDVALHENFGAHESFQQSILKKKLDEEYQLMREANPGQEKAISDQYEADLKDIMGIWDLMRGKYGKTISGTADEWFKRGTNMLRGYGVITKLGGMAFSSLADLAMGIHHTGIKRFMETALAGLCRTEGWNLAREEARALGFLFDVELHNTLPRDLLSIAEQTTMHSLPERLIRKGQGYVATFSGAEHLESIRSRLNIMLVQQEILKTSEAIVNGTATHNQRVLMASIGIDEKVARIFHANTKEHGKVQGSFYLGGFEKWDPDQRQHFMTSLHAGFEKISLNPKEWEKPLFFSTQAGRVIGQWMSWCFTAYDKIVIAGLQRNDANTLFGILTTVGIAAISEQLREIWMNTDPDRRMQPDQILSNAIIRSGLTGHAGVMLERVAGMVGGTPAYYLAGRTVDNTRIATPERAVIQIMGPTAGTLVDIWAATSLLSKEGRNARNVRSLTKLGAFRNTQPFKIIYDQAEEALIEAIVD